MPLKVSREVKPADGGLSLAQAEADKAARAAQRKARNSAIDADLAQQKQDSKKSERRDEEAPRFAPREDVESVEVEVLGKRYLLGPPKAAINVAVARLYGGESYSENEFRMTKTALFVRVIEGEQVNPITSLFERDALLNRIGDNAMVGLGVIINQVWPPLYQHEVRVLKKNLRDA